MKLIFRIFHGPKNLDLILSKRKISCKEIWRQHIFLVLKLDRIFSPKRVLGQDKLLGQENIFYQKKKIHFKKSRFKKGLSAKKMMGGDRHNWWGQT